MSAARLLAEHGSPLWIADADRVRANARAVRAAFGGAHLAYSYKTNRLLAFLRALDEEGVAPEVVCEAEYALARDLVDADGEAIVVNGPAKPDSLLERAADDGALVVVDTADELERVAAAGGGRVGLRVALDSFGALPSRFGIAPDEIEAAAREARALGLRVEALSAHLVSTDFAERPAPARPLAADVVVHWPKPPAEHARAARTVAALARAVGAPLVDLGGGWPGAADLEPYARAVEAALRDAGFSGDLLVEPGRALVRDAVDLACTVVAVKTLADGTPCAVLDAGTNLVPGALWGTPRVEPLEVASSEPHRPTLLSGPLCLNVDVVHPAAGLPPLRPGDTLLLRDVGAYQQVHATQFGEPRPAVVVWDGGEWSLARRRERLDDLVAAERDAVHLG
jgi:diaminopimelate decarboxylase